MTKDFFGGSIKGIGLRRCKVLSNYSSIIQWVCTNIFQLCPLSCTEFLLKVNLLLFVPRIVRSLIYCMPLSSLFTHVKLV